MQLLMNLPLVSALVSRFWLVMGYMGLVPSMSVLAGDPGVGWAVGFILAPWTTIMATMFFPFNGLDYVVLAIVGVLEILLAIVTWASQNTK